MKKIICLALALIMMFAMGIEAFAWTVPDIAVNGTYDDGKISSISADINWSGLGGIDGHLVLMTQPLESPLYEPGSYSTGYGDFTDYGNLFGDYADIEAVAANTEFGVIEYTSATYLSGSDNTISIDLSGVELSAGIYYIYLWVDGAYCYPDFLVAAIKVEDDGTVKYSPVKDNTRNTYDDNDDAFQKVTEKKDYSITVVPSTNGSVSAPASANEGEEVTLTITPDNGYEVDTVKVEAAGATTEISVNDNKFTMPASDVTVTVTFKEKEPAEPAPDPIPVPESEPDRIVIDMNGEQKAEAEGEENPNTGAPVFAPAVIVLGALALIRRK